MSTIKLFNNKTFAQMTDSEKQDLSSKLVRNEIGHCFSNCFSTLFSAIDESHVEYDDMYSLLGSYDYETAITDHINDKSLDELLDMLNDDESLKDTKNKFHSILLNELKAYLFDNVKWDWKSSAIDDVFTNYADIEEFTMQCDEDMHEYMQRAMPEVVKYFSDIDNLENFVGWIDTNKELDNWIGVDIECIKTSIFESLNEYDDSLENYANENGIDGEWSDAYEHWIISSWLASHLSNTADVCGLTIWARYITGQSICLDHEIQSLAFDLYSTEVDETSHINKIDAIKAIITASVKPDMVEHVSKVIFDDTTAYQLSINADGIDYEQRKTLETRITNNVKRVNKTLELHNITL